jgi:exopolyphosphatase/guanosine-5'-triphosphate,3'-diphosphate pyrophosphatase
MPVVPRWEWRIFGDYFGPAETRISAQSPERMQESDEIYVVSPASDASVKLRDDQMDVKERLAVNTAGLEQWKPVLKKTFPLAPADVEQVFDALMLGTPALERDAYDVDALADALRRHGHARALRVHKRRVHYRIGGCMTELSELTVDGSRIRTIAIEDVDPARVEAAVHDLGLDGRTVVCMALGLKSLTGVGGTRYAVIDVGTNSVKFCIGEREQDGSWRTVVDRADVTRLGEGLAETGELGAEPIERTAAAISEMVDEARREGAHKIAAVGTAGMRTASNAQALIDAVRDRTGVELEVISGDEEARLAYRAVMAGLPEVAGALVVFETGGGSSQFTFGDERDVEEQFSVNVGAARFTERFGLDKAVSADVVAEARAAIAAELSKIDDRPGPDMVVGMGGSITNMAAVKHGLTEYDPAVVQGSVLDRSEIEDQIEQYRTRSADERRAIPGLQPGRAEVILAGACIVSTVLDLLGRPSLTVSDRGLRHGLLVERFGE